MRNESCRRHRWRDCVLVLSIGIAVAPLLRADDRPADNSPAGEQRPFIVSGYLPWYRIEDWSPDALGPVTDLIYFGLQLQEDGRLDDEKLTAAAIEKLAAARRASGCRLMLCVGGGDRSEGFAAAVANEISRERLCDSLAGLYRSHQFDGIDFDWEYPEGDQQLRSFAQLLSATKQRLGQRSIVSVAQSPWRDFGGDVYRTVDRVHVMSYNHRHPHARLEASQRDVERMLAYGCPAGKLVLGVPFYGRNAGGRTRTFAELAQFGRLDPEADMLVGYAFNGRETVRAKTRYALEQNLGGIMIWELGQDAADPDVSLLQAIDLELREQAPRTGNAQPSPSS